MADFQQRLVTRKACVFDFVFSGTTRFERGEQCVRIFIEEMRHPHRGTPCVWLSIIFSEVNLKIQIKISAVTVFLQTCKLFFAFYDRYNGITDMAALQLSRLTNLRALFLQGRLKTSKSQMITLFPC